MGAAGGERISTYFVFLLPDGTTAVSTWNVEFIGAKKTLCAWKQYASLEY
jgi:hypothetical protein